MPSLSFINQVPGTARLPRAAIYRTLKKAGRYYRGRLQPKHLSVVFVSAAGIKKLNNRYRQINKPTNVLSFAPETPNELGDIIICPSLAKREAAAAGKSFSEQVNYLFIHGLLHLLGFDHQDVKSERLMLKAERELI